MGGRWSSQPLLTGLIGVTIGAWARFDPETTSLVICWRLPIPCGKHRSCRLSPTFRLSRPALALALTQASSALRYSPRAQSVQVHVHSKFFLDHSLCYGIFLAFSASLAGSGLGWSLKEGVVQLMLSSRSTGLTGSRHQAPY